MLRVALGEVNPMLVSADDSRAKESSELFLCEWSPSIYVVRDGGWVLKIYILLYTYIYTYIFFFSFSNTFIFHFNKLFLTTPLPLKPFFVKLYV